VKAVQPEGMAFTSGGSFVLTVKLQGETMGFGSCGAARALLWDCPRGCRLDLALESGATERNA
jgi:hypothetical protein